MMRAFGIAVLCGLFVATAAEASWQPPVGVDLTRPRLLVTDGEAAIARDRVHREPYRSLLKRIVARTARSESVALDDDSIDGQRIKSRAAKCLAFLYAIGLTIDGDEILELDPEARQAIGDRARDLLRNLYPRSRLAVDPPLGGWDRDISTSEELMQFAIAYDTLAGAGYDFGDANEEIIERLASLASELYDNFAFPSTASNFASLHQNNHRSKTGAALVTAGIVLAEYTAEPGTDPRGIREPSAWIDYGLDQVDLVLRWITLTGDGAYAEGPFYWRFNSQNLLPFARAWHRLLGGRSFTTAAGLEIPDLWSHPLFARTLRWMLDMSLPDGSLAPLDDGNPGRSYYFGALPALPELASAFAWRWANAPTPFETDGNIELAPDAILTFDDVVTPAPPPGAPSAFYFEGGNAILRSDWSADAVVAMVQGEHDTASLFGRDRTGRGVGPQGHEHADPASFLLHAYGERLLLDPGYLSFPEREAVNQPEHHNIILVDGEGPVDYYDATFRWVRRTGRPPIDGNSSLAAAITSPVGSAVTVSTRYGQPAERSAKIQRRFVLFENRTLLIADDVVGPSHPDRSYSWLLHGNAGGASGGDFEVTADGAVWTRDRARLTAAIGFDTGMPVFTTGTNVHEEPNGVESSHVVLQATTSGAVVRSLSLLHPSKTTDEPPGVVRLEGSEFAGFELREADGSRTMAVRRHGTAPTLTVDTVTTDGTMLVVREVDGSVRSVWAEAATFVDDGTTRIESDGTPGVVAWAESDAGLDVVATGAAFAVTVRGPWGDAEFVDQACGVDNADDGAVVRVVGGGRFRLRREAGASRPAAHASVGRARTGVGDTVQLDASESCAADGEEWIYHWKLVSAPSGSAWRLDDDESATPRLLTDRAGPYRARLEIECVRSGLRSDPVEVLVVAGDRCDDGVDDDLDGLFDAEDPDCDRGDMCTGDCSGEGWVTVDELVRGVEMALGERSVGECGSFDRDGNLRVTVDELVTALDAALRGCGGS